MGRVTKAATGKKLKAPKAAAHQLADPVPEGEVFTDLIKKQWKTGKPIGSGGFGLIYLASPNEGKPVGQDAHYVLKVEPHANGPLFCELSFYMRTAKPEMVEAWKSKKKISQLGMPQYVASGSHERNGIKYRFMIMERFSTDLQKLFEQNGKRFPKHSVFQMGIKLLDVLQYIHDHEYVHGDIKAANILLGYKKGTTDQIYLVDYGLAFRYWSSGKHKEYKEDPRKKHDGTIEFTSRDAHKGVTPSRRGDLEILGYCLVQWLCGELPWETKLTNKDWVASQKEKYMADIELFMNDCFPEGEPPELRNYLEMVNDLEYDEEPNYRVLRKCLVDGLKSFGYKESSKLELELGRSPKKNPRKRKSDSLDSPIPPSKAGRTRVVKSPCSPVKAAGKASKATTCKASRTTPSAKGRAKKSPKSAASKHSVDDIVLPEGVIVPKTEPNMTDKLPAGLELPKTSKLSNGKTYKIKRPRGIKEVMTVATQTSPGLKGLKRSQKMKK